MILTPYYPLASLKETNPLKPDWHLNGCTDLAFKYLEFFALWYLYIRHFLPHEDIYILDNGSPYSMDHFLSRLKEPYEILSSPDCFTLNPKARIHIKRLDPIDLSVLPKTHSNHGYGSARQNVDFMKLCLLNGFDYFQVESDLLLAYNIFDDFSGKDYVTQEIRHEIRSSTTLCIAYIRLSALRAAEKAGKLNHYFQNWPRIQDFGEGEYYKLFAGDRRRTSSISQPSKVIHKGSTNDLLDFVRRNPISHPYLGQYIAALPQREALLSTSRVPVTPLRVMDSKGEEGPKPYAYIMIDTTGAIKSVYPTLVRAVKALADNSWSPSSLATFSPIRSLFEDGHLEKPILDQFVEKVEVSAAAIHALSLRVDELIENSKRVYQERMARLAPGETLDRVKGDRYLFEIGKVKIMEAEMKKLSIRWKEEVVAT